MEISDFLRTALVHIRGVLIGAGLVAAAVAGFLVIAPQPYSATSTMRVIQPTGTLDSSILPTAVEWYSALGDVPAILAASAARTQPPVSPSELRTRSSLAPGSGPGEIVVTVTSSDEAQALSMNTSLSQALVDQVENDPTLQFGETRLSVLVPAEVGGQTGRGVVVVFVTGFLASFVLFFTVAGLVHRHVNWRINDRILRALGTERELMTFSGSSDLAVFLVERSRHTGQTWMAASPGVPPETWTSLEAQVSGLGADVRALQVSDTTEVPEAEVGAVFFPDPNDGGPAAIAAASLAGSPALVMVSRGSGSRALRGFLDQLQAVGVPVMAAAVAPKK